MITTTSKRSNVLQETSCNDGPKTFVIGIGSPHGDDAAGWHVIDRLSEKLASARTALGRGLCLKMASVPHDILDWLEADTHTHIVDASLDSAQGVRRFSVQQRSSGSLHLSVSEVDGADSSGLQLSSLRSSSSHQFDLLQVLQLASVLEKLPRTLVLWTISIESANESSGFNSVTGAGVQECAMRIAMELIHA